MLPGLIVKHSIDSAMCNIVAQCQGHAIHAHPIERAYLSYISFCQACTRVFLTSGCAALLRHIRAVISRGTDPQMSRVNTSPIISVGAVMANKQTWQYTTIGQLISNTMGAVGVWMLTNGKLAVPTEGHPAQPKPTSIWPSRFIDLRPKPLGQWLSSMGEATSGGAAVAGVGRAPHEYLPTNRAGALSCGESLGNEGAMRFPIAPVKFAPALLAIPRQTVQGSLRIVKLGVRFGLPTAGAGLLMYTFHCQILSIEGFGRTGAVQAAPGLIMPDYTTFRGTP